MSLLESLNLCFGRYATTAATASPVSQTNNIKAKSMCNIRWRRVVLKISGVALAGTGPNNIDPKVGTGLIAVTHCFSMQVL